MATQQLDTHPHASRACGGYPDVFTPTSKPLEQITRVHLLRRLFCHGASQPTFTGHFVERQSAPARAWAGFGHRITAKKCVTTCTALDAGAVVATLSDARHLAGKPKSCVRGTGMAGAKNVFGLAFLSAVRNLHERGRATAARLCVSLRYTSAKTKR